MCSSNGGQIFWTWMFWPKTFRPRMFFKPVLILKVGFLWVCQIQWDFYGGGFLSRSFCQVGIFFKFFSDVCSGMLCIILDLLKLFSTFCSI